MKISDYAKAQGWLKRHASSENSAGEWEKYVALNTTPELDEAIKTIDDKFGPGTMFPASEAPIPPMTDTQRIMEFNERNPYSDGQLVTPSVDGSRPGYQGKKKKGFAALKDKYGLEEMLRIRDQGKDIPKVREYLNKVLRKKDSVTFDSIADIKKKAGLRKESKVDADISRLLTGEFKDRVQTIGQQKRSGNMAEKFRNILRDIQKTIPKGKKQFINIAFTATKNKLSGNPNSASYSRVLQEPEFNNFVVLTKDVQSNPQIIRFAEEFEKLYAIQDIGRDFELQLAQNIYGDTKPKTLSKIRADASKYAEFLYGVRDVTDADGKRLKMPSVEKRGDYLFELIDEMIPLEEGEKGKVAPIQQGSGNIRNRMLAIRDGLLGLKKGETEAQRINIKKLLKKGYSLDEVAGLAATHELAPGYTELVQGAKAKVNADKMRDIDKPFARIFEQVITGHKPIKGFQYGKDKLGKPKFYQDINEVVKLYNKDAAAYGKKYNIDVPLIEYDPRPGKKINPKNFLPNFKYLSPAAQANVKELADRGIGVRTGAFTMGQLESKNLNVSPKEQMKILKRMGYRCLKSSGGGESVECYMDDVKKTRAEAKKGNVNAMNKQRKAFDIGKNLSDVGKFLRRGVQGAIGGAGTLIGGPIGALIEGAIEGGVYDYYRGKGYNHEQAFAETLIPGALKGRPEGVPWYGGAEELIEKEKIGTGLAAKYSDAKSRYDEELDKYNLINASMTTYANVADWEKDLNAQAKILKDLEPSIKPGTPEYEAYQTAEERQTALMDQRTEDYKSKNRFFGLEWDLSPAQIKQRTPSDFKEKQILKQRQREMDEKFPSYSPETINAMFQMSNRDIPENFNYDRMSDLMKERDKIEYFADNYRSEKSGGGIASLRRKK